MSSVGEKIKAVGGLVNQEPTLLEEMKILKEIQDQSGAKKTINSELWHACAGPLVSLPQVGSLVYYFPQGHSEQVAVSTKRTATAQIPNYPTLPSQLMCQVHNVTLHAEKETDEIYAQMTLQPVNSEKDVLPVPDFGVKLSKHPTEFFCKTLTASDTSTHGGFSVPRRAAEKLFPSLDYSVQPPTQELVVRDLHDNTWTFRHIYRGQPKRHLLTTGWSVFVGSKRLRAGDAVLFIRDEKSQLMLGVRRANHQQTALPSSVLSADSMHIGVLAAAAHAAANRSPFTIFYNPRACPSEFVVTLTKYQKAVYCTQVSIGMRFGMMLETEESSKRRYMGTIIGISDLDPLRWAGSKWHNLQVEWDESGCIEKQDRVSLWEIETPESLFIFPSMTSGFKRPINPGFAGTDWSNHIKRPFLHLPENSNLHFPPVPNLGSDQLMKMLLKPQHVSPGGAFSAAMPACVIKGTHLQGGGESSMRLAQEKPQFSVSQSASPKHQNSVNHHQTLNTNTMLQSTISEKDQPPNGDENQILPKTCEKPGTEHVSDQLKQTSSEKCSQDTSVESFFSSQGLVNQPSFLDQGSSQYQKGSQFEQQCLQPKTTNNQQLETPQFETSSFNDLLSYPINLPSQLMDTDDWLLRPPTCQPLTGDLNPYIPSFGQQASQTEFNNLRFMPQVEDLPPCSQQNPTFLYSNSCGPKDFIEENKEPNELYSGLHYDVSNGGSTIVDPSVSGTVFDVFASLSDPGFQNPSDCLVSNFSSSQDIQSQITTASLADSQCFSLQEFPDNSGGTSSSNVEVDESSLFTKGSWQQVSQPLRTYTKVQKMGAVGRSIDVTRFKGYEELRSAIACMFGLDGLLDDPKGSGWKLVYVDYENDILLVGDDPWEEFVTCVRCIRILSPSEVQQMSEDGLLQ